jgi:predicted ester cyclase
VVSGHGGLVGDMEGTHEGELWGLAPTGRRLRWDAIMIYRMQDGKVVEQWAAEDWTAILHGLGDYTPPWLRA